MQQLSVDLCVIGAGSAGLSIAAAASQLGARVALIEKGAMGGDCLNHGCVPSKALLAAADRGLPFAEAMAAVQAAIAAIAPNDSEARYRGLGVTVLRAPARFLARDRLLAGDTEVTGRRFVLATGARPLLPPIPGLAEAGCLTNETIFALERPPEHLLVLGGGPIGCELAQAFARLGCRVTLVEQDRLLPREEAEAAGFVARALAADGVALRLGARVTAVETTTAAPGPILLLERDGQQERLAGSHLLVAVGRRPDFSGLDLDKAGVALENGRPRLDRRLRTSNRRIFAAGDAAGGEQFTHLAQAHAGVVVKNALFHLPAKAHRLTVPRVTYTEPEVAQVGLTEEEAAARGPLRVLRWSLHDNDRAQLEGATAGLVKVLATPRGQVLGATLVGHQAGELLLPWILAVQGKIALGDLAQAIVPYPTLSEASKRAATSFFLPRLLNQRVRRLVRLLQRLP